MLRRSSLPLLLVLVSSCATTGRSPRQRVEWFNRGVYVGGSLGLATSTSRRNDLQSDINRIQPGSTVTSYDDDDTAWKVFAGYRFDIPFAIEGGYVHMGDVKSEISTTAPDTNAFLKSVTDVHPFLGSGPFLGLRVYPVDMRRLQIGLGAGMWYWDAEVEARAATGERMAPNDSAFDPFLGVNVIFDITDRISLRGDYERFYLDDFEADVFTGGIQIRIL